MNGQGGRGFQVTTMVCAGLAASIGFLLLHRDSRLHDRFNTLEKQVEELKTSVNRRPVTVAAAPGTAAPGASTTAPRTDARPVPPQGGTYVQGEIGEPETLNWVVTSNYLTQSIARYCLDRLIYMDLDHPPKVESKLAVSWEVAEDKRTYTLHLRKNVRFSDGEPFTADDVLFTYRTIMDPAVNGHYARSGMVDVESVEAVDDHTVRVVYSKPYWKGLYAFGYTMKIIPRHWYEKEIPKYAMEHGIKEWSVIPGEPGFGDVFNRMRDVPPGTGPYVYKPGVSWKPSETITLFQNPLSWEKTEAPWTHNLGELQWRFVKDMVAKQELFRKGEIDVITCEHDAWEDNLSQDPVIARIANHFVYDHIGLAFGFLAWNCRKPPFDDARVRRAMTMLMDRETIRREMYRGNATLATCITKESYPEYSHDLEPWPHDIDGARALLAEAGWKDTNGDGILDREGKDFEFEFKYPSGYAFYRRQAAILRNGCTKAGIRMSENPLEWSVFLEQYLDQNFQAVTLGVSHSDPWHDPYDEWHSSQDVPRGNNNVGWRNERADELMEAMRAEFDDGKRAAMFHEFNHLFHQDQPYTLTVHPLVAVLTSKRVEGVTIRPTGLQLVDLWIAPENQRSR